MKTFPLNFGNPGKTRENLSPVLTVPRLRNPTRWNRLEFPHHPFGIRFALFQGMNFYPVYRLCRSNGSFSRIGSLLESPNPWDNRFAPHILNQLVTLFEQKPGETILLGPRCGPVGKDSLPDGDR